MEEYNLGAIIANIVDYQLEDKYTALPAVVLAVHKNGASMTIDAQPLVSIRGRDGVVTEQATVLNVPYVLPTSSRGGMVFPLVPGDNVLLVYSMRGLDTWKYGSGAPAPASDNRMFSKADCIAIPSPTPTSKTFTPANKHTAGYELGDVAIYNSMGGQMCEIIFKSSGEIITNSPNAVTVNCKSSTVNCETSTVNASTSVEYNTQTFKINCTNYQVTSTSYQIGTASYALNATGGATTTGTMNMDGSFVLNGIALETHTHPGIMPGGGSTGGPQ